MFKVSLINNKSFYCDSNTTIFEAAKASGVYLEHSCLKARCRSCIVKVIDGYIKDKVDDIVLTPEEKKTFALSCNAIPTSDVFLDIEDLGNVILHEKKIIPVKIKSIENLTSDIIKIILRLPPSVSFEYTSGQYVNLIKGETKRSYSIANAFQKNASLEFFIKKYEYGLMSKYWFEESRENDLLRMEGPLGSFFLRDSNKKNIILLATSTGIAPIKAILEQVKANEMLFLDKTFWLFFGARYEKEIFWEPLNFENIKLNYTKALSREIETFNFFKGYVQDALLAANIDLLNAQVYACGSDNMIESAKTILLEKGLNKKDFFSDAFVETK